MYEITEEDAEILKLSGIQVEYIDMLLKNAYNLWWVDSFNETKKILSK